MLLLVLLEVSTIIRAFRYLISVVIIIKLNLKSINSLATVSFLIHKNRTGVLQGKCLKGNVKKLTRHKQ